ncbi:MAG: hypothetical protein AMJ55_01555 [Gammaproteobacteria bacterium SG8_15]|jgi:hypothetical protein|nr:MAG: hypothetical protein AMJ55_01555 [Gammaproteobacteria bacterium SG8_15]
MIFREAKMPLHCALELAPPTNGKEEEMIGKKNIAFGFLYLVFTAALGPYMIATEYSAVGEAQNLKQTKLSALQEIVSNGYLDAELNPLNAQQLAQTNTGAILALSASINSRGRIDAIKGGPHAHGNLEAVLNILAGIVLCFLAVPARFKQAISWVFIAGALLHSGVLFLATAFQMPWAGAWLASPMALLGPILVLAGFAMIGIATIMGFRGELVRD